MSYCRVLLYFPDLNKNSVQEAAARSPLVIKSIAAKEQEDYRPLFENFIEDLLTCLNLPEWPSAENVLNLLGRLLVY